MYYHLIATLPGDRRKSIPNKTEEQVLADYIVPYVSRGTISSRWGNKTKTYQVVQLKVFKTDEVWDKKSGQQLEKFVGKKKNLMNHPAASCRVSKFFKTTSVAPILF